MPIFCAPQAAEEHPTAAGRPAAEKPSAIEGLSPYQRLLVPVDFTSASRAAFCVAVGLANWSDGEVWLFHAAGFDGNDEFLNYTGVPWGRADVVEEATAQLRGFAHAHRPESAGRVRIDAVRNDNVVRAVVDACRRLSPSLMVLGVHPHVRHSLRRSVTERIVHSVRCSVLLVHGEPEAVVDADM